MNNDLDGLNLRVRLLSIVTVPRIVKTVVIPGAIIVILGWVVTNTMLTLDLQRMSGLAQVFVALAQVFVGIAVAIISLVGASNFLLEQNRSTIIL